MNNCFITFVQWGIILSVQVLLSACSENPTVNTSSPQLPGSYKETNVSIASSNSIKGTASESARLNLWIADKYAQELAKSPITLTDLGRKELYDQIDDFSEKADEDFLQWRASTVAELQADFDYSSLTSDAKVSYDLWNYRYESSRDFARFRRHGYIFTQMDDPHAWLPGFLINQHKVDNLGDMQAYIKRVGGISRAIGQFLERARVAAQESVRPPVFAYENVISVSKKLLDGAPFDPSSDADTPIWKDAKEKITALLEKNKIDRMQADNLLATLQEELISKFLPAYTSLIDWMESDLKNVDKTARGISALPNGDAYYKTLLKYISGTELSADEIHNLGLAEVARIRGEMESIKQHVNYPGTLQEFFTYIRVDNQFFYPNTDEGRNAYLEDARNYLDTISKKLPDYFGILPRNKLEVKRVEAFREQDGAPQHYFAGTKDGSRPGIYYVHLSDMSSMPKNEMEAIAYHEGIPGHHLQISIARELENIPEFRTAGGTVSYTEGWALYAEFLAKEMGAYADPYKDFGRLMTEMWRAVRLVVDTGIHARSWSEEKAFMYFRDNTPMSEGQIRAEIRRYFVSPGQATGYKIGMLKILELRKKAMEELGDKFDMGEFHDTVLGSGPVPLSILERLVNNWIKSKVHSNPKK